MELFKRKRAKINHSDFTDDEIDKRFKINGTQFDRRRKLTDKQIEQMKRMYSNSKSIEYIALKFNVKPQTVRYHVDKDFRAMKIASITYRPGKDNSNWAEKKSERVAYKRELIASGKLQ